MNDQQKHELLRIARDAVRDAVAGAPLPEPETDDPELNAPCGCFVTLKSGDRLRGCIGQFTSDKPLVALVVEMAKASATSDPRFSTSRITPGEIDRLDIEISVLSPLELTDDPLSLKPGTHGIYIRRGSASGCFLPQVSGRLARPGDASLSVHRRSLRCRGQGYMNRDVERAAHTIDARESH